MSIELFLLVLAAFFAGLFAWAFRALPQEQWQIIASVPMEKTEGDQWHGLNLTFYGFFQAASNTLAVAMFFVLIGALGVKSEAVFALIVILLAFCWPAAKLVARAVEKKKHTFTVGGAVFVGALITPWVLELLNLSLGDQLGTIPVIPAMAAVAIVYAYGEGMGRLACISFGCCYGKSLEEVSPILRRLFSTFSFRFAGATKKAAYEGRLEGVRVVPVQAITSVVFILIALAGTYLLLKMYFVAALILTMTATQSWRFLSELLRADVRGKAEKISVYQVMALFMVIYASVIGFLFPSYPVQVVMITAGLTVLWNPLVLLFCQAVWLAVFFITGRSNVTGSTLSFFVRHDRI